MDQLDRARRLYHQRAWADAFQGLCLADQERSLDAEDIELLAMAAYLVGRDDDYLATVERAHTAYLKAGRCARTVRCAFWHLQEALQEAASSHLELRQLAKKQ